MYDFNVTLSNIICHVSYFTTNLVSQCDLSGEPMRSGEHLRSGLFTTLVGSASCGLPFAVANSSSLHETYFLRVAHATDIALLLFGGQLGVNIFICLSVFCAK